MVVHGQTPIMPDEDGSDPYAVSFKFGFLLYSLSC